MKRFRIAHWARDGSFSHVYEDNNKYLIGMNGLVYENYGESWEKPFWEVVFDGGRQPVIEQYTGFNDNDGNEIYEGDNLMDEDGEISVVKYEKGCFMYEYPNGMSYTLDIGPDYKIVGNIHQ